jgi:hypothetical protein
MAQAVADAKLALQNLPDQYAHTFQGLITHSNMEQQQIYAEQNRRITTLTQTVEKMSALLEMQSGSKKARRRRGLGGQFGPSPFLPSSTLMDSPAGPDPALVAVASSVPPAVLSPLDANSGQAPPLTCPSIAPFDISPLPTGLMVPGPPVFSTPPSSVYHPLDDPRSGPPSLVSSNSHIASLQQANWDALVQKYGELRLQKHPMWSWEGEKWLPRYTYQTVEKISDIWDEWSCGLNGYLSTRELEEGWGAKWRRNNSGLKTENGRRKKVVQLIGDLSLKQGWNTPLALRFLRDRYEGLFKTPRKFCEYLQAKSNAGYHEVLRAADSYT